MPLTTASGPIDLAFAARFLARWPPATHAGASPDGALRLAFVRDDLEGAGGVTLRQAAPDAVEAELAGGATEAQVRRVFGLDLAGDVSPTGARPVLFGSAYEAAAWAVLSARGPVGRAAALRRALLAEHGEAVDLGDGAPWRTFPLPRTILGLTGLPGVPEEKLWRLHGVAEAALEGVLDPAALAALPDDEALARLKTLRGIGDFYAELILVRAVRPDWARFLERAGDDT